MGLSSRSVRKNKTLELLVRKNLPNKIAISITVVLSDPGNRHSLFGELLSTSRDK